MSRLFLHGGGPKGRLDYVADGELFGWAWHPAAPEAYVEVEQWVNGTLVGRTLANQFRPDLKSIGIGSGDHGWSMPLALDPVWSGPQQVELRIKGGGSLKNGTLQLSRAPVKSRGVCDGRAGAELFGWAWRSDFPETSAEVELRLDGVLKAQTVANLTRSDLAGMGHGRYGWRMHVALDPQKSGPQLVELRIKDGDALAGGRFTLRHEDLAATDGMADLDAVQGCVDGAGETAIHGWAWNPRKPTEPVEVQLWLDGELAETTRAEKFRGDLRASGIGNGRCAWIFPLPVRPEGSAPLKVEVRVAGGAILAKGALEIHSDFAEQLEKDPIARRFVDSVLGGKLETRTQDRAQARTFLLYRQPPISEGPFWAESKDDYRAILDAFRPAFERLGDVRIVEQLSDVDAICDAADEREYILVCFGEPKAMPLEARCQVLPIFGWGFPQIPTGAWDGDPRSDWRTGLRFSQRAVTVSPFAAQAVQRAMGDQFAVRAVAPPIADDHSRPFPSMERRMVPAAGTLFDSREHVFDPDALAPPPFAWRQTSEVDVEGVVFTSCLDMDDGRKNFWDIVTAFVTANRNRDDAVLLLRLAAPYAKWQQLVYEGLRRLSPFTCRVVAVRGEDDERALGTVIDASHWYVSAANAEATCLPMLHFMAAERPVIAPTHTAFADYVDSSTGLPIRAQELPWDWPGPIEYFSWSQHPADVGPTTIYRPRWTDLVAAFAQGYEIARANTDVYRKLSEGARGRVASNCSVEHAAAALDALLNERAPLITHMIAQTGRERNAT